MQEQVDESLGMGGRHPSEWVDGMYRNHHVGRGELNENQRLAVDWNGGPLLVLAGPGAGKTAVLALRIVRLLEEDESASVVALTSTNKAAAEMRDRLDRRLGQHTDRALLSTFHAFAADILGQHGGHLGIRPDFQLLTQDEDRIAALEDVIRDLPGGDDEPPQDRTNLLHLIDTLFSESYGGEGPSSSLTSTPEWLPALFRRYCGALVGANRLDFGSVLHFTNRLLREKPAVARMLRLGWTHLCVDEFQDTNRAQYDLLRLIAPGRRHALFVVADDDPITYQWNGASPRRFDDLGRDYELEMVQLPDSYRCPPEIVERADRLIAHNRRLIATRKTASLRDPQVAYAGAVRTEVVDSAQQEAEFIARDIRERGRATGECAVLGWTNRLVQLAAEGLRMAGHDAFVPQRKSEFDSPVLGVLIEALRLANSRHDRVVLRSICRQWERLTGVAIEPHAVGAAAALAGGDFLRAWVDAAAATEQGDGRLALERIRKDLVDGLRFPGIVDSFLEGEWRSWGDGDPAEPSEEETETWRAQHRDIVREYGCRVPLNTYLQRLDLSAKTPPVATDAIQCITVHRSKGLQFRHVYLIGMAQEVFPSYRALQGARKSMEVQEERRGCFVAITRAQETVTLTRAREYFGWKKGPSQFLGEMGGG